MIKRTIAACMTAAIAVSYSSKLHAEEAFIAPLVEQSVLLDVDAGNFVVIVGERGHILISEDGKSFKQVEVPSQSTLTATTIVGDNIWAVGHDAVILHSPDKGETWQVQNFQPELQRPFLDVLFFTAEHGIAIGAYGLFYRTTDGGKNWAAERHASLLDPYDLEYLESVREESEAFYQQELESILPHLNRVTGSASTLYLAGEAGLLASSTDKGKTWQRYTVDYTGSFFDIKPLDETTVLAVGLRGNVFVSRDNQASWFSSEEVSLIGTTGYENTWETSVGTSGGDNVDWYLSGLVNSEILDLDYGTLVVCGPRSRDLLSKITDAEMSKGAFPWLTSQRITVAGVPLLAMRVNFVGELGWELHHPIDQQIQLFDAIVEAGKEFGLTHFGMYAMESMRLEKSYRMWGADLTREYSILEAGLDRFVQFKKDDFVGKKALLEQKEAGVPQEFITLEIDVTDADAMGSEPVFLPGNSASSGEMIGRATSGCYGHSIGKSLALAYVKTGHGETGTEMEVEILGERCPARVINESPCDPENKKLRA